MDEILPAVLDEAQEELLLDEDDFEGSTSPRIDSTSDELYEHYRVVADKGQQLLRVDKFLINVMHDTSRNRIQAAADAGCIHANGRAVKSNYRVKPGDVITLMLNRPRFDNTIKPEDIPLNIVYEDEALMVINKPSGLVVHPGCGNYNGTLVNAVAWHLRDNPDYDPNDPTVGLVHRIDKDTSGLLVVAKTPDAKTKLCAQFFHKTTRRRYQALVWGNLQEDEGRIEGNIARHPKDRMQMAVFPLDSGVGKPAVRMQMAVFPLDSGVGKPAVTHYRVLERFGYVTLVECILETGRTHQIRAHMKHLGHPLFADERYGGDQILWGTHSSSYSSFIRNAMALCPRQALHAKTLGFQHPTTGEEMDFESDLALDMQQLLDKWRVYLKGMQK